MSQPASDPITALGVVLAALRAEVSEHSNSEEQAHRLGQLARELALVKERLAEEKAARIVRDNRLEGIRKAFEALGGAQVPISDQQAAETGLSIEQNSATDKPQASAVSSKDKSGCGPVLAIPQLLSRPQHHADRDSRLQGQNPANTKSTLMTLPNSKTTPKKRLSAHKQKKKSSNLTENAKSLSKSTLLSHTPKQSEASPHKGEGDYTLQVDGDPEFSGPSTSHIARPAVSGLDEIFRLTLPTASSPGTLRAMSRALSIPSPSSPGMMRGPPIAPSTPAALRIFPASRARDQVLTSRASSSTANKKATSVLTRASGGGAENNCHVDAATAEPVENTSKPSSCDGAGGSPVSNMEKHCWKSEWHGAGKPMNLVNFVRMKRTEMRRDGDGGKAKGRASNQSTFNKEVEPRNTENLAESKENKLVTNCERCLQKGVRCDRQKPCHQCQTHQEDCEYDAPADKRQEHARAEEQSNVSHTRRRQSLSTIDTDNTKVLKNATKRKHKPLGQTSSEKAHNILSAETAAAPPTGRQTSNAAKGSNKPPDVPVVSTPDHSGDHDLSPISALFRASESNTHTNIPSIGESPPRPEQAATKPRTRPDPPKRARKKRKLSSSPPRPSPTSASAPLPLHTPPQNLTANPPATQALSSPLHIIHAPGRRIRTRSAAKNPTASPKTKTKPKARPKAAPATLVTETTPQTPQRGRAGGAVASGPVTPGGTTAEELLSRFGARKFRT